MSPHKEIAFETEICEHLTAHGWLYAERDAAVYEQVRALFPADVLAWVETTPPDAWKKLVKNHGAQAGEMLLARLRDQLEERGTLDVLRHGVELMGLSKALLRDQEDRRVHDPDFSLRAGGGAAARRHAGQAVRRHRRRGAQQSER